MAKILISPMTRKGQVTVPKHVRDLLKIHGEEMVGFRITNGRAELVPVDIRERRNPYTKREWRKIERLANQKGKVFRSAGKAKAHLHSL